MAIVFDCYHCGNPFNLPDEWAGKQAQEASSAYASTTARNMPSGWTQVNWSAGRCRCNMPRTPYESPQIVGNLILSTKVVDRSDTQYLMGYCDLPPANEKGNGGE